MRVLQFWLICLALVLFPGVVNAHHDPAHVQSSKPLSSGEKIVVLELFTTAGCGNCPPADAVLKTVVERYGGNVVALGCHVTYFDKRVRKDPLSLPACDERHESYRSSGVINSLYTPQVVINGVFDSKGNKEPLVWSGIGMAESVSSVAPVGLTLQEDYLDIALPALALKAEAEVWLYAYEKHRVFTINGVTAEEKPYDVHYVNGVLHMQKLAPWSGAALSMALPLEGFPKDAYGYAIIAQDVKTREVLAAGKVERGL